MLGKEPGHIAQRTRIQGTLRFAQGASSSWTANPNFDAVPEPDTVYRSPLRMEGEFGIRAELIPPGRVDCGWS